MHSVRKDKTKTLQKLKNKTFACPQVSTISTDFTLFRPLFSSLFSIISHSEREGEELYLMNVGIINSCDN